MIIKYWQDIQSINPSFYGKHKSSKTLSRKSSYAIIDAISSNNLNGYMEDSITNNIIQLEKMLLEKTSSLSILVNLIDDEFIEIGSSATEYNKTAVVDWLKRNDQSERIGYSFKTHQLSDNLILLTYISSIKDTPTSETKYTVRSSIWRLRNNQWRMIFHQGTPMK